MALEVIPAGHQGFDVATGVTTLEDGGRIVDHESGLVLEGGFIRFREGDFVEVREARVEAEFGVIEALSVHYDAAEKKLTASNGTRYQGSDVSLTADELTVYLEPGIGVAVGEVTGETPPLSAAAMIVDSGARTALLVGPYLYQDGPFALRSDAEGDLLSLSWLEPAEADGQTEFEASTEIDAQRLEALEPYLPRTVDP